jgi:hypothetical protein
MSNTSSNSNNNNITAVAVNDNTNNTIAEMFSKYDDKIIFDKNHFDNVNTTINLLEKKKIKYRITFMPTHGENGLEVTTAIILLHDKKTIKKNKKMISNNKYILFNSWYTKNKKPSWPNSHSMWNTMKKHTQLKLFISIFDFMEKLGKSIEVKNNKKKNEKNVDGDGDDTTTTNAESEFNEKREIEASNEKRIEIYQEFYKLMTAAFTTGSTPSSSFIYDIKLPKTQNGGGGLERLSRATVQNAIETFKILLETTSAATINNNNNNNNEASSDKNITTPPPPTTTTNTTNRNIHQRKRKNLPADNNAASGSKRSKQQQQQQRRETSFDMLDDYVEESQMSSN